MRRAAFYRQSESELIWKCVGNGATPQYAPWRSCSADWHCVVDQILPPPLRLLMGHPLRYTRCTVNNQQPGSTVETKVLSFYSAAWIMSLFSDSSSVHEKLTRARAADLVGLWLKSGQVLSGHLTRYRGKRRRYVNYKSLNINWITAEQFRMFIQNC